MYERVILLHLRTVDDLFLFASMFANDRVSSRVMHDCRDSDESIFRCCPRVQKLLQNYSIVGQRIARTHAPKNHLGDQVASQISL